MATKSKKSCKALTAKAKRGVMATQRAHKDWMTCHFKFRSCTPDQEKAAMAKLNKLYASSEADVKRLNRVCPAKENTRALADIENSVQEFWRKK